MTRKKIEYLDEWCRLNNREDLLNEWYEEKNWDKFSQVEYKSPSNACWKCKKGHIWISTIAGRTLFNLTCPICNSNDATLPIGTKYGCLTIIGSPDEYKREVADKEIERLEKDKADFLQGKRRKYFNVDSIDYFDHLIRDYKTRKYYKCRCKCGLEHYLSETDFLSKKHRYCTKGNRVSFTWAFSDIPATVKCGLREEQEKKKLDSYKRIYDSSYDIDYSGTIHESLEILECVDDNYEELYSYGDRRKKGSGIYKIYKLYRCRCYLCEKEQKIKSSKFTINPPSEYGYNAYNGYYSDAFCDCHPISSFQWIVTKLLTENKVPYRVEVSFPDLYGIGHINLLRYDFSVLNDDGNIRCLIECQGEQHYKPVDEFGGRSRFENQQKNDELKRDYAKKHGMPLLEIPYKIKKYEKVEEFLIENNII